MIYYNLTDEERNRLLQKKMKCLFGPAPTADVFLQNLPTVGYILVSILTLFCLITIFIYVEEIVFIARRFRISFRRTKTIWILAFYPCFSFCSILAIFIPKCAVLVDLVANFYFATCLYNFGRLMISYMGGSEKLWQLVGDERQLDYRVLPLCCCCRCLPTGILTKSSYWKLNVAIMQVAVIRPLVLFMAGVLWANGSYVPGNLSPSKPFLYFISINLTSTVIAVYALMICRKCFAPELEERFAITGKIASLQITLIATMIPNLTLSILVLTNTFPCNSVFSSRTIAEEIFHASLVLMMLPFGLMARKFFRREEDASGYAEPPPHLLRNDGEDKKLSPGENLNGISNA